MSPSRCNLQKRCFSKSSNTSSCVSSPSAHHNSCIPGYPSTFRLETLLYTRVLQCKAISASSPSWRLVVDHLTHKSPFPSSGPLSTFIVRPKLLWWRQNMSASTRPTRSVPRILICLPFLPVAVPKMPKSGSKARNLEGGSYIHATQLQK